MATASHLPKNHRFRNLYRCVAAVAAGYCLVFGIVGCIRGHGHSVFYQGSLWALGLRTNVAMSVLSIVVGGVILTALAIGHNVDRVVNLVGGAGFILTGLLMLALLRSNADFLNFGVSTCIVSFIIGLVLLTAGLFGEVATEEHRQAEEEFRHRSDSDERAVRL